jgi:hypothetical protein
MQAQLPNHRRSSARILPSPKTQPLPKQAFIALLTPKVIHSATAHNNQVMRHVFEDTREHEEEEQREGRYWRRKKSASSVVSFIAYREKKR